MNLKVPFAHVCSSFIPSLTLRSHTKSNLCAQTVKCQLLPSQRMTEYIHKNTHATNLMEFATL